jgi:membrane-associated phospholipid phosphatase
VHRHARADPDGVEETRPSGPLTPEQTRLDLADAADPIPVLPRTARRAEAVIAISCGLAFAALTTWIASEGHAVPGLDRHLHDWVLAHRGRWGIDVARAVRWGGMSEVVLPALLVLGTAVGRGRLATRLRSGAGLTVIASAGVYAETRINGLIGRARPPVADWAGAAGGPSFPSGHTTAATLFAVCAAWALLARVRGRWPRRALWAAAALYAAVIGWSRIWLGVHWPTDVLGGLLFGVAWTCGVMAALPRRRWRPPWLAVSTASPQGPHPPRT